MSYCGAPSPEATALAAARRRSVPIRRAVDAPVRPEIGHERLPRAHRAAQLAAVRPAAEEWKRQIMDVVAPQPGEAVLDKPFHSLFDFTGVDCRTLPY
jgi:ureidoacrylate peracid hydrolase